MVTSTRSISDLAQTVSCDRLPQRMAASMERSRLTCSTSVSSAAPNFCGTSSGMAFLPMPRIRDYTPRSGGLAGRRAGDLRLDAIQHVVERVVVELVAEAGMARR